MAKSKPHNKLLRHLVRIGRSTALVIPPEEMRSLGWKAGQRVLVKRMPRGILIRDAITKKRK